MKTDLKKEKIRRKKRFVPQNKIKYSHFKTGKPVLKKFMEKNKYI